MIKARDLDDVLDTIYEKIARFGRKSLTLQEERVWSYGGPNVPRCPCGVRR